MNIKPIMYIDLSNNTGIIKKILIERKKKKKLEYKIETYAIYLFYGLYI